MQLAPSLTVLAMVLSPALGQDIILARGPDFVLEAKEYGLDELLENAARFLRRNYLVQWSENRNRNAIDTVLLQQRLELDARGCEEVISQLLYSCGWIMTPVDPARGIYEWINIQGNRRQEITARSTHMDPEEVIRRRALKAHVTTSVPIEHLNPTQVGQLIARQTGVSCFPSGNMVVLSGYTDSVANALLTLEDIDRPGAAVEQSLEGRLTDIETGLQSAGDRLQAAEQRLQSAENKIRAVEKKVSKET